jgi:hypothetical protein
MSVVQECAAAEAAIQRARSLFASAPAAAGTAALSRIHAAGQSTTATAQLTGEMSGELISRHKTFAEEDAARLAGAAQTEAALQSHVTTAATLTHTGAQQLDAIAAQTRATSQAAASATTPAAERAVLTALRSQLAQAHHVVNTTTQQADGLSSQIRALKYPLDQPRPPGPGTPGDVQAPDNGVSVAPPLQEPPFPSGPIVWCVRPEGTFGFWRCSVLYPDLSVGTYWSPSDDTGGSLP